MKGTVIIIIAGTLKKKQKKKNNEHIKETKINRNIDKSLRELSKFPVNPNSA